MAFAVRIAGSGVSHYMLRQAVRSLAYVNAAYQAAVGMLLVAKPVAAGTVYQLTELTPISLALCRILGGLMFGCALVLWAFARSPEGNRSLGPLLLAGCVANVTAAVAACLAGEVRWMQVSGSLAFQVALGFTLSAFLLRMRSLRTGQADRPFVSA